MRKPNFNNVVIMPGKPLEKEGESIEQYCERVTATGEPIDATVPMIYTERKEGVLPEYNVRTDRFEIAAAAMDKVTKTHLAKRAERLQKPSLPKAADSAAADTQTAQNNVTPE